MTLTFIIYLDLRYQTNAQNQTENHRETSNRHLDHDYYQYNKDSNAFRRTYDNLTSSDLGGGLGLHPQRAYLLRYRGCLGMTFKLNVVGSFQCDKMAIILHRKTCKYSFITLTCQAEDNLFISGVLNGSSCGFYLEQTIISYNTTFPNISRCYLPYVLSLHLCLATQ